MRHSRDTRVRCQPSFDLSDGFRSIMDQRPDLYLRAQDASGSIWPARIGTDGTSGASPTYDANDWGSTPAKPVVKFTDSFPSASDSVSWTEFGTAWASDPDRAWTVLMPVIPRAEASNNRHLFGFTSSADGSPRHYIYLNTSGNLGFYTRNDADTVQNNLVSAGAMTDDDLYILAATYRPSATELRVKYKNGSGQTTILTSDAITAPSGAHTFTHMGIGSLAHPSDGFPCAADYGGLVFWSGVEASDAQVTSLLDYYDHLARYAVA